MELGSLDLNLGLKVGFTEADVLEINNIVKLYHEASLVDATTKEFDLASFTKFSIYNKDSRSILLNNIRAKSTILEALKNASTVSSS